jgi:pimeloyl-ACP methyl ester carboxylesterase
VGDPFTRAFVRVGAREWHFRRGGTGPVLIFLHRAPFDGRTLVDRARGLLDRWTVLIPDLPGCGGTAPRGEADLASYAAALVEWLGALGIDACAVAGEREGAALALALAALVPARVHAVAAEGLRVAPAEIASDPERRLPDGAPRWDGSHLAGLWAFLRDEAMFDPWHRRSAAARALSDLPSPEILQRRLVSLLSSPSEGRDYAMLLRAASLEAESLAALRARPGQPVLSRVEELSPVGDPAPPPTPPLSEGAAAGLRRGYVSVAGGQLHYVRGGAAHGVPIVVQHDAASSVRTVRPIVEDLARLRPVIAFDLPGSGDSDDTLPADPVPIELYAYRIAEAIAALRLRQVDFYGMWGGGFVGLELARLRPGLVRRLVLSNLFFHDGEERRRFQAGYTPSVAPLWHGGHLLQAWHQMRDQGLFYPWFDRSAQGVLRREPFLATWMVHERVCSLLKAGDRYRSAYQAHFVYPTLERLAQVAVPTLIATAEWDPNRLHTEAAAAANRHCRFRLLDLDFRRWGSSFAPFLDE